MKTNTRAWLKSAFILGAVIDGMIALSWILIAYGLRIPNILNGHIGTGPDYQFAMYIGAMFMMGWAVLLAWGALKPTDRRDLLIITSVFLFLSVIIEVVFFSNMLGGMGFLFGVIKRLILCVFFATVYFYSIKIKES